MLLPMDSPPSDSNPLKVGASFESGPRTIRREDIDVFSRISGDRTGLHYDGDDRSASPLGGAVAHGLLNLAVASGLCYDLRVFDGILHSADMRFERPVFVDDTVRLTCTVAELDDNPGKNHIRMILEVALHNQDGRRVLSGTWTLLQKRDKPAS